MFPVAFSISLQSERYGLLKIIYRHEVLNIYYVKTLAKEKEFSCHRYGSNYNELYCSLSSFSSGKTCFKMFLVRFKRWFLCQFRLSFEISFYSKMFKGASDIKCIKTTLLFEAF